MYEIPHWPLSDCPVALGVTSVYAEPVASDGYSIRDTFRTPRVITGPIGRVAAADTADCADTTAGCVRTLR